MSEFRTSFVNKLLKVVETEAIFIKPAEIGILKDRYMKLYENNDTAKARLFEQLCVSVLLWGAASSDHLFPGDDLKYIAFMTACQDNYRTLIHQFTASK